MKVLRSAAEEEKNLISRDLERDLLEGRLRKYERGSLLDEISEKLLEKKKDAIEACKKQKRDQGLEADKATEKEKETRRFKVNQCVELLIYDGALCPGSIGFVSFICDSRLYGGRFYYEVHFYEPVEEAPDLLTVEEKDIQACLNPPEWFPLEVENGFLVTW